MCNIYLVVDALALMRVTFTKAMQLLGSSLLELQVANIVVAEMLQNLGNFKKTFRIC